LARIAVVIPSIGRPSLERAVDSARWADEIRVAFDSNERPVPGAICYTPFDEPRRDWGHWQRNHALSVLAMIGHMTHVSFMDDDDRYTPDAGSAIRKAVEEQPDAMHVFLMQRGSDIIGKAHRIEGGHVGTPMMVVPTHTYGTWGDRHEGDFDFARTTAEKLPVVWHDHVIALIGETR
jgi:hypothetical protein